MNGTEMKQIVERLFALIGEGDWDAIADMLTDDFVAVQAPLLPYSGVYKGREALRVLTERILSTVTFKTNTRLDLAVGTDHVVLLSRIDLEDREARTVQVAETFKFRDGKICEVLPHYFDPLPALLAAQNQRGPICA